MNFQIKTQGYKHKFKASMNELIIECYGYDGYIEGEIRLVINKREKNELIETVDKLK